MIVTISEFLGWFSVRSKNPVRAVIFMASLLLLGACDQQSESGRVSVDGSQASMSFTPPTQLLTTRSIVRANLILEITIDGQTSVVEPNAAGVFEFRTTRPANSSTSVTIVWSELIDGELLPLARATKRLDVGSVSSAAVLRFSSTEFDTTSDDRDQDGFSNYIERRDGDNGAFNDPDSPVSPPVFVTVDVRLALPVGMRDATADRRAEVTAQALVNREDILLSREGDVWTGSATVTENTEPLVTVIFYAMADQEITIASLARSQNIGGGGQAIFNEGDYEVDIYNDDGDGFNNIREIAIGSNPRDSNDPRGPIANAGADISISSGATVTLNGSGSSSDSEGTIATYRWTENAQQLGTGVSPVIAGLSVGPHEIELLVTDNLGLTDTDSVTVTVAAAPVPNQSPVANAGADQTIASGASVTLDGSGSSDADGTIATYQWSEGAAQLGTGVSPVVAGLTDGSHVITLLVTDDDGDTDTETVTVNVTVAPNQPPEANAGADQAIASGASVTLNGSGSSDADGTITSYQWSEGTVPRGSGISPVVAGLTDGSHVITLLVTDDDGDTDTDTVTINVTAAPNQPPEANAGTDQAVDSGASVTLNGSGSSDADGTIATYQWSEGTVPRGSGISPVVAGLTDGSHVITLLVTDDDGDTDTDTVTVNVTAAPNQPPEANAGTDQAVDSGASVTLNGSGSSDADGTIATYQWSEGAAQLGTGVSPVIPGLSDGPHDITLLVTDNDGATDTDTVTVNVTAAPNQPPEANAGTDQAVDSGASVTLNGSGSSDADGTIATYQWSEGAAQLGTGVSPVIPGLSDGPHDITLLVTDNEGATDTDTVSVTVTAAPENQPPEANAGADQTIASGASVTLNGSVSSDADGTIATYRWSEGAAQLGTGVSPVIPGLSDGPHDITLLVTDDDGAMDTDMVSVDVTAPNQSPLADAGVDQTIASGASITLNGSGSTDADGTIALYQWSEGAAQLGTGVSPVIPGLSDGPHDITLQVTDNEGAMGTDSVSVTVTAAGETGDEDATANGRDDSVDGAKTSATGEFVAPMRTLA